MTHPCPVCSAPTPFSMTYCSIPCRKVGQMRQIWPGQEKARREREKKDLAVRKT